MDVAPQLCCIDKTGFLVRRDAFLAVGGFPEKDPRGVPTGCDGKLAEALVAAGVAHGKVQEVLVVHN